MNISIVFGFCNNFRCRLAYPVSSVLWSRTLEDSVLYGNVSWFKLSSDYCCATVVRV